MIYSYRIFTLSLLICIYNPLLTQNVVFTGLEANAPPPASGNGIRLMWYAEKAALRAGQLINQPTYWNQDSIGEASTAFGLDTKAKGTFSMAWGETSEAIGAHSIAGGFSSVALGISGVAIGHDLISKSYNEVVLGLFNADYNEISPTSFEPLDRIFVLGNGSSNSARSNALEVYKNGNFLWHNALSFQPDTVLISSDNQLIDVTTSSYLKLDSNNNTASNRTAILSSGTFSGQTLILECLCSGSDTWELLDKDTSGGIINLPVANRIFISGSVIHLSWTGSEWREIGFTQN